MKQGTPKFPGLTLVNTACVFPTFFLGPLSRHRHVQMGLAIHAMARWQQHVDSAQQQARLAGYATQHTLGPDTTRSKSM